MTALEKQVYRDFGVKATLGKVYGVPSGNRFRVVQLANGQGNARRVDVKTRAGRDGCEETRAGFIKDAAIRHLRDGEAAVA